MGVVADSGTRLTIAITVLMAGTSAVGVAVPAVYRDNLLIRSGWLGNDLVTLLVAVPLLVVSTAHASRGSARGMLASLGLSAYALYNYAFYAFGAAFNGLFLAYVAIMTLATFRLIGGLASPATQRIVRSMRVDDRLRLVGAAPIVVATVLGAFWIGLSLQSVATGRVPAIVTAVGHPTNVIAILDLWLVVSFGLVGGIWLWRRHPWGVVVTAIWATKGAVYMLALSAASVTAWRAGAADFTQLGLWVPIGLVCGATSAIAIRAYPEAA